ncbi:hypothetical protein LCGC14_2305120, partial [marine sediment metagenome]
QYDKAIESLDDVLSFLEEIRKEYGRFFQFFVGEPLFFINKDLKKIMKKDDVVLIKGSRFLKMEKIFGFLN